MDEVRAGDTIMVLEPEGWHPRVVRSVTVVDRTHVVVRYRDGMGGVTTVVYERSATIEVW